jgi:glutathione S-transferase
VKLYGTFLSPYTARVVLVVRAKGHELDPEHPPTEGAARGSYLKINPTGKMPFLDDDGFYIPESAVIADYLDAVLSGPPLWPADQQQRTRAALYARLVDVWVAPGLSGAVGAIIAGGTDGIGIEKDWKLFSNGLRCIEHYRDPADAWLHGNHFGHPDAALIPFLFSVDYFDTGAAALLARHPGLEAYWLRAKKTPIVSRILVEMAARADVILGQGGPLSGKLRRAK